MSNTRGGKSRLLPPGSRQIDVRGVVLSGDAMFDRRSLRSKIVPAHGDYRWTVKENEKGFYQDSEVLFQPHRKGAGTSAPPRRVMDERDKRSIIVSSLLADYSDWPELAQVFKLERQSTNALGITQTRYATG